MEPINLYLEKLRLHRADKVKTAPITKFIEKHQQDTWSISNLLGRGPTRPLLTSLLSIKIAIVEKANRFATKQKREEIVRKEA